MSSCDSSERNSIEVGQQVWVLRSGGPLQEAVVASVMKSSCNNSNHKDQYHVTVEWEDESGEVLGKTVPIEDVFPRRPGFDKKNANKGAFDPFELKSDGSDNHSEREPEPEEGASDTAEISDDNSGRKTCEICKLSFKNERDLNIHIVKKHPLEANNMKVRSILKEKKGSSNENKNLNLTPSLKNKTEEFNTLFYSLLAKGKELKFDEFESAINDFTIFLKEANNTLPGPQHPAVRFYRIRKRNKASMANKGYTSSSNPVRANRMAREKRKEKYQYEVAQYNYYNRRRKVVRDVMDADAPKLCPVEINTVENHFKNIFQNVNECTRNSYESAMVSEDILTVDIKTILEAIRSTSMDSSPGPDGVLIRTIKILGVATIIKSIIEIMLRTSYVPNVFSTGRTVLVYKGKGDRNDITSWRPITVYPMLRRLIEKVLDRELRSQIAFHSSQRGFVKGLPGTHVNARIVDAILKDAKAKSGNCAVAFLDVTAAFDSIGHSHIQRSLQAKGVSANLSNLINSLLVNNSVAICIGPHKTGLIDIKRGVPQGGPLSPTLFNVAIDHLYKDICDPQYANKFGYRIDDTLDSIVLCGFADDQAVSARDEESAKMLGEHLHRLRHFIA
ncbi:hypothetical protein O3M35_012242 [Rhynocoris fuscipes]|uniref:Reverse transcriptase domain-containing protein n=1 Tax=Rhynocoris fuscipes TaxID=488301 RepID=A0AAW1CVN0_9HEMI